jgi:hypothetical protein
MDKNGEYIQIKSTSQFWEMVHPINDAHLLQIMKTNFYQTLARRGEQICF